MWVIKTIIQHPFGKGLYHQFLVTIRGWFIMMLLNRSTTLIHINPIDYPSAIHD